MRDEAEESLTYPLHNGEEQHPALAIQAVSLISISLKCDEASKSPKGTCYAQPTLV
jgi:hypothetical protein